MDYILNFPRLVLVLSVAVLWLSEWIGTLLRKRWSLLEEEREDFNLIVGASLTLVALLIGFTFSMSISRYDQRKNYEEAEANAIGTEYVRADLLPAADAAKVRPLLRSYLDQRILFYKVRDEGQLRQIDARTAQLQSDLWSAIQAPAMALPTPMVALAVSGMNDVLNSQGYTQAAWLNRIPRSAWNLMIAIAICSHLLIGYGLRRTNTKGILILVLPVVVSISFFLIADIDSPRRGIILLHPENLASLARSLQPR